MNALMVFIVGITVVASANAVLFSMSTSWYTRQAGLWRTDRASAQRRSDNPPWWVRYFEWTTRITAKAGDHE